jgi:ABC-2 type transport system permease protein
MFKLLATIKKDMLILLRDKVGIALIFIMPIVLVIVVTSIQNSTFQLVDKNKLSVIVCNTDTGKESAALIQSLDKLGMFKVVLMDSAKANIANEMNHTDAMLGIIIPPNFSAQVIAQSKNMAGKAMNSFGLQGDTLKKAASIPPLTLYYNPVLQESMQLSVKGAVQSALQMVESRETLRRLYFAINDKQLSPALENEMMNNRAAINSIPLSKNGSRKTPNATQHNVPAWTIFAMFFVVMSLSGSVVREKISGSFIRLKTLPTNFMVALLSKQVTYMIVTILQAAVIFSIGIWLFPYINLPALNLPADLTAVIITTLICGWCAVSYSICVGVFAKTQEQANAFGAISIVIMAAIGGLMVPSFAMQGIFKTITGFSPMHWCLEAYYSLFLQAGKLSDIRNNLALLLIITVLLQFITYLGLKRKNLI